MCYLKGITDTSEPRRPNSEAVSENNDYVSSESADRPIEKPADDEEIQLANKDRVQVQLLMLAYVIFVMLAFNSNSDILYIA